MTILFANFLVYLLWLVWAMKKNKWHIDVFCLVLSFYVLISFLGFFTCVMGIYQNTFGNKDWENLSVVPYVMALMCTFLFLIPLRSWKISQIIPDVSPYVSFFSRVSFVLLFIFAAQAVLSMMNANVSNLDYADVYNDAAAGTATSFKSGVTNFVYSKVIALARVGAPFFYIFQCLLLVQTKKIKHIIMILVAHIKEFIKTLLAEKMF